MGPGQLGPYRVIRNVEGALALFALGNLAAGLSGHSAGYLWAGMAALGLAGHVYAARGQRRGDSSALGLRLYSMFFAAALALVAVVFTVLAVTSGPEQTGRVHGYGHSLDHHGHCDRHAGGGP